MATFAVAVMIALGLLTGGGSIYLAVTMRRGGWRGALFKSVFIAERYFEWCCEHGREPVRFAYLLPYFQVAFALSFAISILLTFATG